MIHIHPPEVERLPMQERPVVFDGCKECDERVKDPMGALCRMDGEHMSTLWGRMWASEYGKDLMLVGSYRSLNEQKLGRALYLWSILLQRFSYLSEPWPPGDAEGGL